MEFHSDGTGKREVLKLDGDLTVRSVGEIRSLLLSALEKADEVILDMEALKEADLCGIQLLCSARRSARRLEKRLRCDGPLPEAFVVAAGEAGDCFHTACAGPDADECAWRRS